MAQQDIEKQARKLAQENREAEPGITKIFWFPDDNEVRLVELLPETPIVVGDTRLNPVYFRPAPQYGLPSPSVVAIIHPDEFGKLELPETWGTWDDAEELE